MIDHTVKRGTTDKIVLVFAHGPDGLGTSGLRHDHAGATAAWVRDTGAEAHAFPLVEGRLGEYRSGGIAEVDPETMPGIYQVGLPDDMLAEGAESAFLVLRFEGTTVDPVAVSLVAYDPQDEDRLGMEAIGPEGRIRALRGAFPMLTQRELDEAMARREGPSE